MNIPSQYLPVMPYLIINKTKDFVVFAKNVFKAVEQLTVPGENNTIMHGEIKIHNAVITFSEASGTWKEKTAAMYLYVEDVNTVYDAAMKNNAKSLHTPQQKDYGFTAGFLDPFGNHWFIVEAEK